MTKVIHLFLTIMVIFALLSNAAWAQELETPIFENIAKLTVLSDEPVELHIGLIEEQLADNYPLEMAFLHQYPNGKIVYHLLTPEQLSAYLLSNESTIDLLILTNRLTADFAKQDSCINFYDTTLFSAWPETWINVRSQAEIEGKLFGFPKAIHQDFYGWNEPLAHSVGIDKPNQIWTWDDYRVLCQTLPYDLDGDDNKEFLLMRGNYHMNGLTGFVNDFFEQYAYQYALRGSSFQTTEFEHLNQLFIDILSSGALSDARGVVSIFKGEDALLLSAFTGDSATPFSGDPHSFLPYPTLNAENPGYVGWFYTYSLLKSAPHPELAINFLKNALNPDIQSMTAELNQVFTRTLPKYSVVNEAVSLFDAFAPDAKGMMTYTVSHNNEYTIYPLETYIGEISPEDFETYQFMREHLLLNTGDWYELSKLWFETFVQYTSDVL